MPCLRGYFGRSGTFLGPNGFRLTDENLEGAPELADESSFPMESRWRCLAKTARGLIVGVGRDASASGSTVDV